MRARSQESLKFGAFVDLSGGKTGMVHISEVAPTYVKEIRDYVTEGQTVKVKILNIGEDGKISLSIKKALDPAPRAARAVSPGRPGGFEWKPSRQESGSFEDMMSRFKQASDERCWISSVPWMENTAVSPVGVLNKQRQTRQGEQEKFPRVLPFL